MFPRLRAKETFRETMFLQQCFLVCGRLYTNHLTLTLKMTFTQVVETSVSVISNSPSQDYSLSDDCTLLNYDMTPGFKPFLIYILVYVMLVNKVSRYFENSGRRCHW